MKRIISVLLCFVLLASVVMCAAPVSFAAENGIDIPLIYVEGQGATLYKNLGTPEQKQIYPIEIPEGYIEEKIDQYLPVFTKAFFTQNWDEFCVALYDCVVPLFYDVRLDNNGDAEEGCGVDWTWQGNLWDKKVNGKYQIQDYVFKYDWRIDPWETADKLHDYIEAVKAVTGAEEVALLGRCLGASIVAAYMTKYDGEHVSECIFYASASHGAAMASKAFCGELYLESSGIERYVYDIQLFEDETLEQLIESLATILEKTYGLDIACWAVNNVYEDIYLDVVPPIISETFATFPGYWSMVTEEDFEKAKDVAFYGYENGEYDGMIAKLDNYHVNTRLKMDETYIRKSKEGVEFSNIAKYGRQIIPVSNMNDVISDDTCEIVQSSMGVTSATVEGVLSDEHIEASKADDTFKYISPDKQLDASTCLFPDSTWFIKDIEHENFPNHIENIFTQIINIDGFTVFDNPDYPQYLVYDRPTNTVVPMTEANMNTTARWDVTFFEALKKFFESLFIVLKNI
ncbi:MAG: hypothetical protein IKU08_04390 [Clostridia bacterium]|nr:hypothetical protein [Clostridia bacterium]